ncbi:hypothetical protein AOV_02430 [Anaplasma ovis str. Haibei]|uniref:Uncharacterized protein n=1 Tax=Anaplasma ovis str. Haibei TaxID=1248439 RepID=A0A2Z2L819_9RICK|nr:hypothetical protein [Anaplasma ovis]ASI47707.1 hypothetical protein AOV_02430 [Anaplasma ovis str. Haibei]
MLIGWLVWLGSRSSGAEILGLLTGAAGVSGLCCLLWCCGCCGALLFAGTVAVITCACCCCRSTVEIGPSKVVAQVATNSGVAKVMVEVDPSAIKDAAKNAKIPVISMKEIVVAGSKKDNTEYDVIENYKPQQVSKIKWLNAPPVGGPTMKLVMAVVCVAVAVTSVSTGAAAPVIAIAVVSCAFYASAAAAYVCRRKAGAIKDAVKAGQLAYAPAEIGEIAPDVEPEQSTSKPPKQEKCQGVGIANEEDWVPVAKAAAVTIGTGAKDSVRVGAKEGAAAKIAKASTSNSDVMKSLAGEKDFLEAGADLYQAIASAQDWEPVVGNVATVAQQSRAR